MISCTYIYIYQLNRQKPTNFFLHIPTTIHKLLLPISGHHQNHNEQTTRRTMHHIFYLKVQQHCTNHLPPHLLCKVISFQEMGLLLKGKVTIEFEIQSPPTKFFPFLTKNLHNIQNICEGVHEAKVHQGDWHNVGSVRTWTITGGTYNPFYLCKSKRSQYLSRVEGVTHDNLFLGYPEITFLLPLNPG